jgi:glycosyltransferase involved in cell wall biosynthesis
MKVSVIIPFTDRDTHLLKRAVKSVETQTVLPHEVIPVHDKEYRGIPWARNTGVDAASGDLILPLDCDDWIEPTYLEKTIPLMVDKVGIVSTQMVYFGELEGTIIRTWKRTYAEQLQGNNIPVCSLIRAEALRQAGPYDGNLRGWEDWDMWLRILKLGWTHDYVNEILFHYRLHSGGMNQWANENKATLKRYLGEKHPGFLSIRKNGKEWNGI